MRPFLVLATALACLAACSRADVSEGEPSTPTAQGSVERIDRLQYLSDASATLLRIEDAYSHQKPADEDLGEANRLVLLAYQSAASGKAAVEAAWEKQAREALEQIGRGISSKNAQQVSDGLTKVKLYLDQAQQAASIEY